MTDIVKPRYYIETTPIESLPEENRTILNSLSFRVVDSFTGMPIGTVAHSSEDGGKFRAFMSLTPGDAEIDAPEGGWGVRSDLAALEVWKSYSTSLPRKERFHRWLWRWMGVGWFLFGTVWGVLTSFIVQSL